MTRNIPQPIWCIGPQKVFSFRWLCSGTTFVFHRLSLSLFMSIFSLPLSFSLSSYVCSSLADRSFSSSLNSARDTNDAFSFPFSLVVSANYFYVSLPFLRPFFGFPLALSFFDFLRRIVRRGRTQFCSSKLAVIVELYDKPTLMVKACPRRRGASLFS